MHTELEWSGSPCPLDPDNFWIDDETGERVCARTGCRFPPTLRRALCVDGSEFPFDPEDGPDYSYNESNYVGDGQYPPFVVFDIGAQENIALNLPTRNAAEKIMSLIAYSKV